MEEDTNGEPANPGSPTLMMAVKSGDADCEKEFGNAA